MENDRPPEARPEGDEAAGDAPDTEDAIFMPTDDAALLEEGVDVVADLEGQMSDDEDDEGDGEGGPSAQGGGDDEAMAEDAVAIVPERDDARHVFASVADPETGEPRPVYAVAWNRAQPAVVAFGGEDDLVHLCQPLVSASAKLPAHEDSVVSMAFDASGQALASGGMDGRVCIWDVSMGQQTRALEGPGEAVEFVRWHPQGSVVLAGSEDFTLWMWNATSGACMQVFTGHQDSVTCGSFTSDGRKVVSGSLDHSVRVWNPKEGACIATFQGENFHAGGITSLDCSPDKTSGVLIAGSVDGNASLIQTEGANPRVLGKLALHEDSVESVGICGVLPLAATGSLDGKVGIWDCNTLTTRTALEHPMGVIRCLWHPAEALLFTACLDGRVRVWDARTGDIAREFIGHAASLLDMALNQDGTAVITGADDGTCRIFTMQQ